ncbi:MAG: cyclopropane-fatty-acyl-phospholipid synthase family protein [Pseudomonadota bacterium]
MSQEIVVLNRDNFRSVSKSVPLVGQIVLNILKDLEYGSLTVEWPNGMVVRIDGPKDGCHARINLHSYDLIRRVLKSGDVGVGESFMDGAWTSPDVTNALQLFCENQHLMIARKRGFWTKMALSLIQFRNRNTRSGSKRNISAHYDLGNAFYSTWLDPSMTYSSAIFAGKPVDLKTAQEAKYESLARHAMVKPDDHVLEVGCGWGGFAEYAAREIGCKVTGLTISREQLDFAQKRIFEAGLNEKVDIVFRDYREERGSYDRIASIEMFEAVGEKYWPVYFDMLKNRLKPGGMAGLQIITIQERFFESYRRSADFIQRYIFPGGMLPTPQILNRLGEDRGLNQTAERIFGHDYADTLAAWRRSFQDAWPDIEPMGFDERFKRMWEFYFHYCEAGFRSENIDVRQVVYTKQS